MNIQLTISMLVSDRMETLGKCLSSLKPLLRELDSELIVVFTGKKEKTLELVRQYTSQIIRFEWCNDFAKARNAGLNEAKGEWFLYLDDDEWFDDTTELIHFFKSGEYRQYQSAFYVVRNYQDLDGKDYSDTDVGRMCRITPETRFVFPIHENLVPFDKPNKKMRTFAHHYGYAKKEKTYQRDARTGRNIPLLMEMLEENPASPQVYMQLTQEYRRIRECDMAVEYCRKGLGLARKEDRIYNYELWLQVNLPLLISYTGDYRLALKEGKQILRHPRTLEVGALHLCVTLVALCRDLKEYQEGLKYVRRYHEKLLELHGCPTKAALQRSVEITFESGAANAVLVYVDGLTLAAEVKDFRMIRQIFSWFPWDDKEQALPQYSRLEAWKNKYETEKNSILAEYARLDTDSTYVSIQKMLYAEKQGDIHRTEELWHICANDCPPGFQWELIEIAVRNHILLKPLLKQMPPETWDEYTEAVTERKDWDTMQEFYRECMPLLEGRPFYAGKLEQRFLEKMLTRDLLEPSELIKRLEEYCTSVCSGAETVYREEALASPEDYALPTRYRFAAALKRALRLIENEEFIESFPYLKEALRIYPRMSGAVGQLLRYLEEEAQAPRTAVSEEFQLLGAQVKQALRGLMETGRWEEAQSVIGQLLALLPDDIEALRMKQEILRARI